MILSLYISQYASMSIACYHAPLRTVHALFTQTASKQHSSIQVESYHRLTIIHAVRSNKHFKSSDRDLAAHILPSSHIHRSSWGALPVCPSLKKVLDILTPSDYSGDGKFSQRTMPCLHNMPHHHHSAASQSPQASLS